MSTFVLTAPVSKDGTVTFTVPADVAPAESVVRVRVDRVEKESKSLLTDALLEEIRSSTKFAEVHPPKLAFPDQASWVAFIDSVSGSITDPTFVRPEQPPMGPIVSLD